MATAVPHLSSLGASASVTWEEAVREFLLHKRAAYSPKTAYYFDMQLRVLARWAQSEGIPFHEFGKRHMDRYTAWRASEGKSRITLRHDGVCAKNLFDWCAKNDLLERSKLAEYEVHNAPKPHKHMPADEEVSRLLQGVRDYWSPDAHPAIRFMSPSAQLFHRTRNAAIIMGLIDTTCRVGEALHLRTEDVKLTERSVVIREAKGKEPRTLPVGSE